MSKTTFSDGNASTGVLGTIITAGFLNALNTHRHMGTDADGDGALDYAATSGSANAYLLSFSQALPAYITGMPFFFKASFSNTGAATMNINSLGAKAVKKNVSDDVETGDIIEGKLYMGMYDGTNIVIINIPKSTSKISSYPDNYSLAASIASNALTITRKGDGGVDLTSSNIATCPFRNPTLTLGTIVRMLYSANASITIPQGATLGYAANESGRFYVYEGTDGTNTDIGIIRKAIVPEASLFSSTAMSTGATSDTTLYSTAGRTSWVWKCVGYIEATMGATLGNWSSIEKIQMMGPGVHRTGDIVDRRSVSSSTIVSIASSSYQADNNLSIAYSAQSAINVVRLRAVVMAAAYPAAHGFVALSKNAGVMHVAPINSQYDGTMAQMVPLEFYVTSPLTSSGDTYFIAAKTSDASILRINTSYNQTYYSGSSTLTLEEIKA